MKLTFFEKTGCKGNARQKALLENAGYSLDVFSILGEKWTTERLRPFFGDRPVEDWFNWKAPAVTQGDVDPETFTAEEALTIMLREPILIRRPLIEYNGWKACGFDDDVQAALKIGEPTKGMEACQQVTERCP